MRGITLKILAPTRASMVDDSGYAFGTDCADHYRSTSSLGVLLEHSAIGSVCQSIEMLHFLSNLPWNNLALNYVLGLRPSCIRVATGEVTTDSVKDRVTVYLKSDNRTVARIEQEMWPGAIGVKNGADLHNKLLDEAINGPSLEKHVRQRLRVAKHRLRYHSRPGHGCSRTKMPGGEAKSLARADVDNLSRQLKAIVAARKTR